MDVELSNEALRMNYPNGFYDSKIVVFSEIQLRNFPKQSFSSDPFSSQIM
jgi:hypothetical protein